MPTDVEALAAALGTNADGVIPAWEAQVQEIAHEGETAWLERHGIPYDFSSWS